MLSQTEDRDSDYFKSRFREHPVLEASRRGRGIGGGWVGGQQQYFVVAVVSPSCGGRVRGKAGTRAIFRLFITNVNGTFFGIMSESLEASTRGWNSKHVRYDSTNKPNKS